MKKTWILLMLICATVLGGCQGGTVESAPGTSDAPGETTVLETPSETPSETPTSGSDSESDVHDAPYESASDTGTHAEPTTEVPEVETVPPAVDDPEEDRLYETLDTRHVGEFARHFFTFAESGMMLYVDLPGDWETVKAESGYRLMRDGREIGALQAGGKQGSSDWKLLRTVVSQTGKVLAERYLEKNGIGETLCFRYRYYFRFQEGGVRRIMTMTVDYTELDADAAERLMSSRGAISNGILDPGFGTLTEAQWGSIAILGNSFISSSSIGGILYDMHVQNGKAIYVDAQARGYSHIDTYVNDPSVMSMIREGQYQVVFVCGVNSTHYLEVLKETCDASNTTLVVLPAHNEPQGDIDAVKASHPDIRIMDWKAEIDALIADGRDMWDFCVDDIHKHSTPLAGYVGAHMIYRAIWGEVPTGESGYGVTQEEIDAVLGDYAKTGCVIDVDADHVIALD